MKTARYIATLLLLAVLLCPAPSHCFAETGRNTFSGEYTETDGMLRVLLKSLGEPEHLTLYLDGIYSFGDDTRFSRGTLLRVALEDGSIWIESNGMSRNVGKSFKLIRHASDSDTNGIYIRQTTHNNIYNGDIEIFENSGSLGVILHIYVEDYLYGVLPYEMNDSWPIEALKAQAVAARTYALSKKTKRTDSTYDLVDTTGDQVFRGFDPSTENAIEAVDATCGIAGIYNGTFATLYYGGSNGGQTALPGDVLGYTGDYGYLNIRDDPYDLENPSSRVGTLSIACGRSDIDKTLADMLIKKASDDNDAISPDSEFISVDYIVPSSPLGSDGSRMASVLRFGITLSSPSDNGGRTTVHTEVRLDLFGCLKEAFDELKISSGKFEMYTVIAVDEKGKETSISIDSEPISGAVSYRIEARRFGHGIGMSQRGAQTMAGSYEKTYDEILAFYYPGVEWITLADSEPQLPASEDMTCGFDRDVPGLLPLQSAKAFYGRVCLPGDSISLNVRKSATTNSDILGTLMDGQYIVITETLDGWYKMVTNELEGYVSSRYVIKCD